MHDPVTRSPCSCIRLSRERFATGNLAKKAPDLPQAGTSHSSGVQKARIEGKRAPFQHRDLLYVHCPLYLTLFAKGRFLSRSARLSQPLMPVAQKLAKHPCFLLFDIAISGNLILAFRPEDVFPSVIQPGDLGRNESPANPLRKTVLSLSSNLFLVFFGL